MSNDKSLPECNLVMKGGLTSGIVYPPAINEIAQKYRFVNIAGTSAGAIGAVGAAAAEYRRQKSKNKDEMDGFKKLNRTPDEIQEIKITNLFQPTPSTRPLYRTFLLALKLKKVPVIGLPIALLIAFWPVTLLLLAMAGGLVFWICNSELSDALSGAGLVLFSLISIMAWFFLLGALIYAVIKYYMSKVLTKTGFGICSGQTEKQSWWQKFTRQKKHPGLTEWLGDTIDRIAYGIDGDVPASTTPLCVKDIEMFNIHNSAITTDLSSGRPIRLPFKTDMFLFRKSDFEKIFPKRILKPMIDEDRRIPENECGFDDLYFLPSKAKDIPIVFIARLSLSFPILLSAVPIYQQYFVAGQGGVRKFRKLWLSDGGISSNFPIHMFDKIIPDRQTFGIRLGEVTHDKNDKQAAPCDDGRIGIRKAPKRFPKTTDIESVAAFFGSIFRTAQNWHDNLQSNLQSYAERIVTINLDPRNKEGGLNLDMEDQIGCLKHLGELAGRALVTEVDIGKNRYDRMRVSLKMIEEMSINFHEAYQNGSWAPNTDDGSIDSWDDLLGDKTDYIELMHDVDKLGGKQKANTLDNPLNAYADLRIVASEDIEPAG